jgi:branched-chain amino acid aminotransferase
MDRGLTLGLSLFETLLAIDGRPTFADRHFARLAKSCERLGWQLPQINLGNVMEEILERNDLTQGRARIRLTLTAGAGPIDSLTQSESSLCWMIATPVSDFSGTLAVNYSPWPRNEYSPLVGLKSASYAENLIAIDHARKLGFDETIFLNTAGHLCESATANLFLVKDGRLLTPSLESGCLPGVAREVVLEIARRLGVDSSECVLTKPDLDAADEVFLTSSLRGLSTVSCVGEQNFPNSAIISRLRQYWDAETRQNCSH